MSAPPSPSSPAGRCSATPASLVWELPFFGAEFVIWRIVVPCRCRWSLACWRGLSPAACPKERRRMIYLVDGLLWLIALALGLVAASRSRQAPARQRARGRDRLPPADSAHHDGRDRRGLYRRAVAAGGGGPLARRGFRHHRALASPCSAARFTPGGPVIGFSIGAAALKGGAGAPQVIAYRSPGPCSRCSGCSFGRFR